VEHLAKGLGIKEVFVVGNKVQRDTDREFIRKNLEDMTVLGFMRFADDTVRADLDGRSPYDASMPAVEDARAIKASLDARMAKQPS
jgi:CO dehydrogenase maturation factor